MSSEAIKLTYVGENGAFVAGWPAQDHEEGNEAAAIEKIRSGLYAGPKGFKVPKLLECPQPGDDRYEEKHSAYMAQLLDRRMASFPDQQEPPQADAEQATDAETAPVATDNADAPAEGAPDESTEGVS